MGRGRTPGLAVADGGSDTPSCSARFPEFRHAFTAIHRSGLELLLHCAAAADSTGSGPADCVLPHQANGRIDAILARPLGLAPERIVVTADWLGNTGSAAIWLALSQVEAAIGEFGLGPWTRSPAGSLSGGWARRLQLAVSLLHSPRLVLLDQPTAGLDAAARQEVWRCVEARAATGTGVIVCTHDLVEAERCSQTAFFAEGQVVAAGAPAEIAAGSPAVAFLLCGTDVRLLANDVTTVAGVIASYPQGKGLRVVADPVAELDLRRFAAMHAASLARVGARLEDAILTWSLPMGRRQT
jgi:hypothetical protein